MNLLITAILLLLYVVIFTILMKVGITSIGGIYLEKGITFSWPGVLIASTSAASSGVFVNIIFAYLKCNMSHIRSFIYGALSLITFVFLQSAFEGAERTIRGLTRFPEFMSTIYLCMFMGLPSGHIITTIANKLFNRD